MKREFITVLLGLLVLFSSTVGVSAQTHEKKPGVVVYSTEGKEIAPQVSNYQYVQKMAREIQTRAVPEGISMRDTKWTNLSEQTLLTVSTEKQICRNLNKDQGYNPDYRFYPALQTRYNSSGHAPNWSFNQNQLLWRLLTPPAYLSPGKS